MRLRFGNRNRRPAPLRTEHRAFHPGAIRVTVFPTHISRREQHGKDAPQATPTGRSPSRHAVATEDVYVLNVTMSMLLSRRVL